MQLGWVVVELAVTCVHTHAAGGRGGSMQPLAKPCAEPSSAWSSLTNAPLVAFGHLEKNLSGGKQCRACTWTQHDPYGAPSSLRVRGISVQLLILAHLCTGLCLLAILCDCSQSVHACTHMYVYPAGGAWVRCSQLHGPHAMLIGDAGHSVSPSMGQGCNCSLEDTTVGGHTPLPANARLSKMRRRARAATAR